MYPSFFAYSAKTEEICLLSSAINIVPVFTPPEVCSYYKNYICRNYVFLSEVLSLPFSQNRFDRIIKFPRYLVLPLVLYNTAVTAKLIFQNVDPYYTLFNLFTGEVAISAYIKK
jgi:hypothetical protein